MKGQEYENLTALYEDLDLMFENCKEYNRPDSRLHKDGIKLQRAMKHKYDEMAGSDENEDENSDENSEENSDEDSDEDDEVINFSEVNHISKCGVHPRSCDESPKFASFCTDCCQIGLIFFSG